MVPNCVSGNDNHSLLITLKESQLAIQFFHCRLPLCPVQLPAVSRVNIVANSTKFSFPMILVWDRKRVNVARYSLEDHLIGWWVGRQTHFVSGRQTVGRPRERPRSMPFPSISGGPTSVRASGPRRTERPMEWKSILTEPSITVNVSGKSIEFFSILVDLKCQRLAARETRPNWANLLSFRVNTQGPKERQHMYSDPCWF